MTDSLFAEPKADPSWEQSFAPPPPPDAAPSKDAAFTLAADPRPLETSSSSPADATATMKDAVQRDAVRQGDAVLASDHPPEAKADMFRGIAASAAKPGSVDREVAARNQIAVQHSDQELADKLMQQKSDLLIQKELNAEHARAALEHAASEQPSNETGRTVAEFTASAIDPSFYVRAAQVAKKYNPDFGFGSYIAPASVIAELQRQVSESDPEKSKAIVQDVINLAHSWSGYGPVDSHYGEWELLQTLLSNTDDNDRAGMGTNALAFLNLVPGVGAAIKAAKGLRAITGGLRAAGDVRMASIPEMAAKPANAGTPLRPTAEAARVPTAAPAAAPAMASDIREVPATTTEQTAKEGAVALKAARADARAELESAATIVQANKGAKGNAEALAEGQVRLEAARKKLSALNNKALEPGNRVFAVGGTSSRTFVAGPPKPLATEVIPGTAADALSRTTGGTQKLVEALSAADPKGVLATVGTSPEAVAGSHAIPSNTGFQPLVRGPVRMERPPYRTMFFGEDAGQKLANDFNAAPSLHISRSTTTEIDGGVTYDQAFGRADGTLYPDRTAAEAAVNSIEPGKWGEAGWRVEQEGTGYVLRVKGTRYLQLSDNSEAEKLVEGGPISLGIRKFLGKNTWLMKPLNSGSSIAAIITGDEAHALEKMRVPFDRLPKRSSERVQELLHSGDEQRKWFGPNDPEYVGLSEKERAGYDAIRQINDRHYHNTNLEYFKELHEGGYRYFEAGGAKGYGRVIGDSRGAREVLDLDSGHAVAASDVGRGQFVEFYHEVEAGAGNRYTIGFIPDGAEPLKALPRQVLNYRDGYIHRGYQNGMSWVSDKRSVTVNGVKQERELVLHTAPTLDQAEAVAANYRASGRPNVYARSDRARGPTTFQDLVDQGLSVTSRRGPSPILDINGQPHLTSVVDAIHSTAYDAAMTPGIRAWARVAAAKFNKAYGDLKVRFDIGNELIAPKEAHDQQRWAEAIQADRFIRRTLGVSKYQIAAVNSVVLEKMGNLVSKIGLGALGRDVSTGLKGTIHLLNKATSMLYLVYRPGKQFLLQQGMVPLYAGAVRYSSMSRAYRNWAMLVMGEQMPGTAAAVGKRLGMSGQEFKQMMSDYKAGAIGMTASEHPVSLASSYGRISAPGAITKLAERMTNTMKEWGLDAGIRNDLKAAWAVSYESWKTEHGKLPSLQVEHDAIAAKAKALSLNMDRGDLLPTQSGYLGAATLFMSQQFKMFGRLAMQDKIIPKSTQAYMGAMHLAVYGLEGFGATAFVKHQLDRAGVDYNKWPSELMQTLVDGVGGYLANGLFRTFDKEGTASDISFSNAIAPGNFLGTSTETASQGFLSMLKMGYAGNSVMAFRLPQAGVVTSMVDVMNLGWHIMGGVDLPLTDKAQAAGLQLLREFPVFSDAFKAHVALAREQSISKSGVPVDSATRGEAMAALVGIPSKSEKAINEIYTDLIGRAAKATPEERSDTMVDQGHATAKWMQQLLFNMHPDGVTPQNVFDLMQRHASAINGLDPFDRGTYLDTIQTDLMANIEPRSAQIVRQIWDGLNPKHQKLTLDEELPAYIRRQPDFDGKDVLLDNINAWLPKEQRR